MGQMRSRVHGGSHVPLRVNTLAELRLCTQEVLQVRSDPQHKGLEQPVDIGSQRVCCNMMMMALLIHTEFCEQGSHLDYKVW